MNTCSGQKRLRQTTIGWKFLVQWNYGSKQWIDLQFLKDSNPVQVAEYAVSCDIDDEPAFGLWVPYTLQKRDVTIAAINSRVKQTTQKYGIEVTKSINEGMDINFSRTAITTGLTLSTWRCPMLE